MIIDIHSHVGDPWYAYWKQNVDIEDHLASMEKWGIEKRCVSWWQPHNAPDKGNKVIADAVYFSLVSETFKEKKIFDETQSEI